MSNDAMLKRAKQLVVDYFNERVEKTDQKAITADVSYGDVRSCCLAVALTASAMSFIKSIPIRILR